jgi:hypothetical protein
MWKEWECVDKEMMWFRRATAERNRPIRPIAEGHTGIGKNDIMVERMSSIRTEAGLWWEAFS